MNNIYIKAPTNMIYVFTPNKSNNGYTVYRFYDKNGIRKKFGTPIKCSATRLEAITQGDGFKQLSPDEAFIYTI
jgi:hypothetical protein